MTVNRGLWVPINTGNVGTTEVEARLADVGLFESNNGTDVRSGILNAGISIMVTGSAGPGLSFILPPCTFLVGRNTGEGVYRFSSTGTTTVATTAAPVSGSRIDVLWVKQNDQTRGDANNLAVVGVTQGAASGTPVAPNVPAGALELAQAVVTPTTTALNTASITQTYRYAALRGTPISVRNVAERDEITNPRRAQMVRRLDLGPGAIDTWSGTAWVGGQKPLAHLGKTDGFTAAAATQTMTVAQLLRGGMTYSANGIVVPIDGLYRLSLRLYVSGAPTGLVSGIAKVNGATSGTGIQWTKSQVDEFNCATGVQPLAAGDKVTLATVSPSSVYGGDGYNGTWLEVELVEAT